MACVKLVVYSAGHGSVIFGGFFILHLCIQNLMLWMMTSLSLTSLRVNTDLMSLTQHHSLDKPVGFPLTVINMSVCPPPQATDVASEIKRKMEKKEKKRKKKEKKLAELDANGETNGDAEVSLDFYRVAACFDLRFDPNVVLSQCTTCYISLTPNHWLVLNSGLDHWSESDIAVRSTPRINYTSRLAWSAVVHVVFISRWTFFFFFL